MIVFFFSLFVESLYNILFHRLKEKCTLFMKKSGLNVQNIN